MTPKPAASTYDAFARQHGIDVARAAMFEDLARNLEVPKRLGMRTVLIVPQPLEAPMGEVWEHEGREGAHIDFITDDLAAFLTRIQG